MMYLIHVGRVFFALASDKSDISVSFFRVYCFYVFDFLEIGKYHRVSRESPLADSVKPTTFVGKYQ